jgi:hypothetical protein
MASRIRIRRGTTTQWNASTKILESAELGLDSTLNKLKIGDGINLWSALPFINVLPSELSELAQDAVESAITAGTGITKNYNDTANTITLAVDSTIANKTYVDTAVTGLGSTAAETYIPLSSYGNADGVATLDENGNIPISELGNLIDGAPALLDTLNELAAAINDDASYAATITTALGLKAATADIAELAQDAVGNNLSNLFTYNDSTGGINLDNAKLSDFLMDGASGNSYGLIGTSAYLDVKNTNGYNKEIELDITAVEAKLVTDGFAKLASPTFTGTVGGITKDMVGLSNVDNTSDNTKALITYIPVSSATRTISSATDKNTLIECSVACTITIPNDTQDAGWPVGSMVEVRQIGTGQVTITKDAAVTMQGTDSQFKSRVQWSTIMLEKRAANSWLVTGDTTA